MTHALHNYRRGNSSPAELRRKAVVCIQEHFDAEVKFSAAQRIALNLVLHDSHRIKR